MSTEAQIRRGDLYWLRVGDDEIAHPHVVVQDDVFNSSRVETTVVCALTSNLSKAKQPGNVLLEVGEGGLDRQSVIVVSQISSVQKSELTERIGALAPERVGQALQGLRFIQRAFLGDR